MVKKPDGDGFVIADIPGLIQGASEGVGLGFEFLRHVERTRFLIHLVDLTLENPVDNYLKINEELKKYGGRLADIYQIIVLNKIDAINKEDVEKYKAEFKKFSDDIFAVSAATGENIEELMYFVYKKVDEIPHPEFEIEVDEDLEALNNDDSEYEIIKVDKDAFLVQGGKVSRLASVTDVRNTRQVIRLQNILTNMGVFEDLKAKGAKDGDTIIVSHVEFVYYDTGKDYQD